MIRFALLATLLVASTTFAQSEPAQAGPPEEAAPIPTDLTEQQLLAKAQELASARESLVGQDGQLTNAANRLHSSVVYVDELLRRFPESSLTDQALLIKLQSLGRLARIREVYLRDLLVCTAKLSAAEVKGKLGEENAFYAIQAFVLGARHQNMPKERRLLGTFERYEAFLEDYPQSERLPMIWASLIRNAIELGKTERAVSELAKLSKRFPNHQATRRAKGEVFRVTAVGTEFDATYPIYDGTVLNTKEFRGKVLIVHFWSFSNKPSLEALRELTALHELYGDSGLELIGVSLDENCGWLKGAREMSHMTWPICCEGKGHAGEVAISHGITTLPAYFVIDRKGVLRSTNPGEGLSKLIEQLLKE